MLAGLCVLSCTEDPVVVPEHHLTEQERKKQHLDESFSAFASMIDLKDVEDAREFIRQNSEVSLGLDLSIVYTLRQDGETLVRLRFRMGSPLSFLVDGTLYGGLELHGSFQPFIHSDPEHWEEYWDIHVFDNGEDVATLGVETLDQEIVPVLRFPDGTSYSLSTLLLIEPLVDYLLENVFSTE